MSTKAGQDTPEEAAARRATAENVEEKGVQVLVEAMAPKMFAAGHQNAELLDEVRDLMAQSKPAGVIGALLGMAERPDATPLLAQIVVPTLIITGADDAVMPPAESEKFHQGIRGSQLKVIFHAGHLVALEQPEEFNSVLKEWLSREDAGWPPHPRSDKE